MAFLSLFLSKIHLTDSLLLRYWKHSERLKRIHIKKNYNILFARRVVVIVCCYCGNHEGFLSEYLATNRSLPFCICLVS